MVQLNILKHAHNTYTSAIDLVTSTNRIFKSRAVVIRLFTNNVSHVIQKHKYVAMEVGLCPNEIFTEGQKCFSDSVENNH